MATIKLCQNAAIGTFARLRKWWGSKFPLKQRLKLWYQTIWPTLTYGICDVGCTARGLQRLSSLALRQLRRLARSPIHLEHESHMSFCKRLKIQHPADHICTLVYQTWARRLDKMQVAASSDMLCHLVPMCKRATHSGKLLQPWWELCLESWLSTGLLTREQVPQHRVCKLLGLEAPSQLQITLPPLPPSDQAKHCCDICGREFAHQMALRQHLRHKHSPAAPSNLVFNISLDTIDGLPQCRYCRVKFRYWLGLKQHLDRDTCPYRNDRVQHHANPPNDSALLPLASDHLSKKQFYSMDQNISSRTLRSARDYEMSAPDGVLHEGPWHGTQIISILMSTWLAKSGQQLA